MLRGGYAANSTTKLKTKNSSIEFLIAVLVRCISNEQFSFVMGLICCHRGCFVNLGGPRIEKGEGVGNRLFKPRNLIAR